MPIVEVKLWKGVSKDAIEKIISGMTKVLTHLGIPEGAIDVVVQEITKTHWGVAGQPATVYTYSHISSLFRQFGPIAENLEIPLVTLFILCYD